MNNVTFDETPLAVVHDHRVRGGLAGFLMRHRLAKTFSQAQRLIVLVALVCFAVSGLLIRATLSGDTIDTRKNFVPAVASSR